MESNELDLLVYRIIQGHYDIEICGEKLVVHSPSSDLIYESEKVYNEIFRDAQVLGIFEDEDVYEFLLNQGQWTEQDEEMLTDTLPKNLKEFKKGLYQSFFRGKGGDRQKIRKFIKETKKEILRLQTIRYNYGDITCRGVAFTTKNLLLTERTTYKNKELYDFSKVSVNNVMNKKANYYITENQYREIARNAPWVTMWYSHKHAGNLFSGFMTEEQQQLVDWSSRFDNMYQAQDCPPDDVFNDHDALDGWLIIRQEQNAERTLQQEVDESLNAKVRNAGEIYLPANESRAEDELESFNFSEIQSLNDEQAAASKESKLRQIENKGHVREQDFVESQRQLRIQATNEARRTMTGN